jgi:hypothetical protein
MAAAAAAAAVAAAMVTVVAAAAAVAARAAGRGCEATVAEAARALETEMGAVAVGRGSGV